MSDDVDADQRLASTVICDKGKENAVLKQTSTVAYFEIYVMRCVADMPKLNILLYILELELQFLQVYHEVAISSQGKVLSQVKRFTIVAVQPSKF